MSLRLDDRASAPGGSEMEQTLTIAQASALAQAVEAYRAAVRFAHDGRTAEAANAAIDRYQAAAGCAWIEAFRLIRGAALATPVLTPEDVGCCEVDERDLELLEPAPAS